MRPTRWRTPARVRTEPGLGYLPPPGTWPRRLSWFPHFPCGRSRFRSRLHGSSRARRTTVQPVQLSLLPEQSPRQPDQLIDQLPQPQLHETVTQLARLIAKMTAARRTEADDE